MPGTDVVITHSFKIPITDLLFRTSRSGGHGGQNVNKLETRVELILDLANSPHIPEHFRQQLLYSLSSRLDSSGNLRIVVQESRSQWKNKQLALEKLKTFLKSALKVKKKRVPTKPTKHSKENRIRLKKVRGETKRMRKITIE